MKRATLNSTGIGQADTGLASASNTAAQHPFNPQSPAGPKEPDTESWEEPDAIERLLANEDPYNPRVITPKEMTQYFKVSESKIRKILTGLKGEVDPEFEDESGTYYSIFALDDVNDSLKCGRVGGDRRLLDQIFG